jgi:DNA processing protein
MPEDDDFEAWFRLLETPGVGRETARRLLAACGSARAIFSAPRATLAAWVGSKLANALLDPPGTLQAARAQAARDWLAASPDHSVLKLGDTAYPTPLLRTADPPLMLYVQGNPQALLQRSVAVVGSRSATAQGLDNARAFGRNLAEQGLVVVSGLATGIDAAAHEGALAATRADSSPGLTVAVVGTGLDRVYPLRHRELAARIARAGAVVSEYAPGTPALPECVFHPIPDAIPL